MSRNARPRRSDVSAFKLTGWSGGTFGLRVDKAVRERLFLALRDRLDRERTDIVLPGEAGDVTVSVCVSETFWSTCPEFRSSRIGDWMKRRGDRPWPKGKPPKYSGELTSDGARVTVRVRGYYL